MCDEAFALPLSLSLCYEKDHSFSICVNMLCAYVLHTSAERARENCRLQRPVSHRAAVSPPARLPTGLLDHTEKEEEEEEKREEGCPHVSMGRYVRINSHKINTLTETGFVTDFLFVVFRSVFLHF